VAVFTHEGLRREARMFEVRIHGRGGQGVVTAAEMLSFAAFLELQPGAHRRASRRLLPDCRQGNPLEGEVPPLIGRKVIIYGGGNTALDAARAARRLDADEAIIVYRRTREKMPAHDFELEEALQKACR